MMRVISINVNGIRSANRKGLFSWLLEQQADVICLQETKAQLEHLEKESYCLPGYHCFYHDSKRKGYSGVALYAKKEPKQVQTGLGWPCADDEGRYLQADFADISIASLYLPSGSSGEERQKVKFEFMEHYRPILQKIKHSQRKYIICGDWNVVHKEIDIKNFKGNQKNSGCLPEERAWLNDVLTTGGFIDAFREINQQPEQYTWWSNRGQAWEKNVGWRIDYQIITSNIQRLIKSVNIYKEQRFSDHAPLIIDYDYKLL